MEYRGNRSQNQAQSAAAPSVAAVRPSSQPAGPSNSGRFGNRPDRTKLFKIASTVLLFGLTGLVVSLTFLVAFNDRSAISSVKKNQYQAVFLNNGQVYFGKIARIGTSNIDLRGIYYLQTNSATGSTQSTSSNVSLVKLGCELHAPNDQMIINNDQVIFWENIQDSGQVVKAIKDYQSKGNQQCSQASQSSTQQSPASTTPTSGTTTKP